MKLCLHGKPTACFKLHEIAVMGGGSLEGSVSLLACPCG